MVTFSLLLSHLFQRFAIPFSLATSLGLASTALMLPINSGEAGSGLVPPAVADHLLGDAGAVLILIMLFMAIVSTGSAESIAVSSLIAYDIYREYFNPEATGKQILWVSRIVIVCFGIFMGLFSVSERAVLSRQNQTITALNPTLYLNLNLILLDCPQRHGIESWMGLSIYGCRDRIRCHPSLEHDDLG